MTQAGILLAALAILGVCGLWMLAARERRGVSRQRAGLFDEVAEEWENCRVGRGRDGFPTLSARLSDGRPIDLELVPDTLQFRRLPQLWLKVTIREEIPRPWPRIGALARPTGAEFYSLTARFPERLLPPSGTTDALLIRGDRRTQEASVRRICAVFTALFEDPGLKEAAITPRGVRIVRQAAEGDRGAHLLLRQVHFPLRSIAPDLVRRAIADAALLRAAQAPVATAAPQMREPA